MVVVGAEALWFAMPITEAIVAVYVVYEMVKYTRQLKSGTEIGTESAA